MNTRGQEFIARQNFVEVTLHQALASKPDFDYIKYARDALTDSEYIRIADLQGKACTIDITGRSLEEIVEDVARIVLIPKEKITPPETIVTNPQVLRSIAPLFKRESA